MDEEELARLRQPSGTVSSIAEGRTCALPGCDKPPYPSLEPSEPHLACGNLHHQLLMATRFHPDRGYPAYQEILDRNSAGECALKSCSDPPYPGHSWCSRQHYLDWLFEFTSSLEADQYCKLPGCTRHVFVEEDSSRWQYCGWKHWKKFVVRSALHGRSQKNPLHNHETSGSASSQSKSYHVPSPEGVFDAFSEFVIDGIPPDKIGIDEDFFNKHPWDTCGDTYWLIVLQKDMSKTRGTRFTKDGYRWKQQGRAVRKNNALTQKYFTYQTPKGKQNDAGFTYHLKEYTVESNPRYALINVLKGSARRKRDKGMKFQDNNDLSSKNMKPQDDEDMSVECLSQSDLSPELMSPSDRG